MWSTSATSTRAPSEDVGHSVNKAYNSLRQVVLIDELLKAGLDATQEELRRLSFPIQTQSTSALQFAQTLCGKCEDGIQKQMSFLKEVGFPWAEEVLVDLRAGQNMLPCPCPMTFIKAVEQIHLRTVHTAILSFLEKSTALVFFQAVRIFVRGLKKLTFQGDFESLFTHICSVYEKKEADFYRLGPVDWHEEGGVYGFRVKNTVYFKEDPFFQTWVLLTKMGQAWDPKKLPKDNRPLVRAPWEARWDEIDVSQFASLHHPAAVIYMFEYAETYKDAVFWSNTLEKIDVRIDTEFIPRWTETLNLSVQEFFWAARGNLCKYTYTSGKPDSTFPLMRACKLLNAFGANLESASSQDVEAAMKILEGLDSPFVDLLKAVGSGWTSELPSDSTNFFCFEKLNVEYLKKAVEGGNQFAMWLYARRLMLKPFHTSMRAYVIQLLEMSAARSWRAQKTLAEMGSQHAYYQFKSLCDLGGSFQTAPIPEAWRNVSMSKKVTSIRKRETFVCDERPAKIQKVDTKLRFSWRAWMASGTSRERRLYSASQLKGCGLPPNVWALMVPDKAFYQTLMKWETHLKEAIKDVHLDKEQCKFVCNKFQHNAQFFADWIELILLTAVSLLDARWYKGVSFSMFAEWYLLPLRPLQGWSVSYQAYQKINKGRNVSSEAWKEFCGRNGVLI